MAEVFEKRFVVGWRDVDANGHVANTAYLQYAVDTRIAFFADCGFPPVEFIRQGFGPVIKSDNVEYFRELLMFDAFRVTMENGGFSDDGSRFRVVNKIYKNDGEVAAVVTSIGGWLSLDKRKLIAPSQTIKEAWGKLTLTEDFEILRSSIKH